MSANQADSSFRGRYMSSRLQLDVCNLSLGRRHLVNAYEVEAGLLGLDLGLGLEAKFSGLGLETSGLGLEAFGLSLGLGLVFLALALASFKAKAKVKMTNMLPNTVYHGIITLTVHWYTSVMNT